MGVGRSEDLRSDNRRLGADDLGEDPVQGFAARTLVVAVPGGAAEVLARKNAPDEFGISSPSWIRRAESHQNMELRRRTERGKEEQRTSPGWLVAYVRAHPGVLEGPEDASAVERHQVVDRPEFRMQRVRRRLHLTENPIWERIRAGRPERGKRLGRTKKGALWRRRSPPARMG